MLRVVSSEPHSLAKEVFPKTTFPNEFFSQRGDLFS
jgi:hypothetical protein